MINEFRGEYRWLSNFWYSPVMLDGDEYPTVEHAYQAAKSPSDLYRTEIRKRLWWYPGKAKALGRTVQLSPEWSALKIDVMRDLLAQKFAIGSKLATRLLETGVHELVEGNTWGDVVWGVCNGVGENWLGRLLMERRDLLRAADLARLVAG